MNEPKKVLTYEDGKLESTGSGHQHDPIYIGLDHIAYSIADLMFDYPEVESYKHRGRVCKQLHTKTIYEGGETLQFRFQRATKADDEEETRWCADPQIEPWTLKSARMYVSFAEKVEKKWEKVQEKSDKNLLRPFDCPVGLKATIILMGAIQVASVYYMKPGNFWKRKVLVDRSCAVKYAEEDADGNFWIHIDPPETN